MRFLISLFIFPFIAFQIFAQMPTQTLRGRVLDKENQQALAGATVQILELKKGANADANGVFRIESLPVGRYTLQCSMIGFNAITLPNVELSSAKETILNIELTENPQFLQQVVIKAQASKDLTINELALVSGRQFTVQESNRYAGGFADPARMAFAFAGVASSGTDQNNEIVIRGNSPKGLLWRLEGVEIPNPNHFSDGEGATSGIVSIINGQSLANSDFLTGAFPAEYGNASSGVFDLRLRKGNDQQHEFAVQLGLIGTEASLEGPLNKKGASYRANFRYSTLDLLLKSGLLKIDIGTFKPQYQDFNLNLNFPTKAGTFSIFSVGGKNNSTEDEPEYRSRGNGSLLVTGLSHKVSIGAKSYQYSVLALSKTQYAFQDEFGNNPQKIFYVDKNDEYGYQSLRFSTYNNYKFNSRSSLRTGLIISNLGYDLLYQRRNFTTNQLVDFLNDEGSSFLVQAYSQYKHFVSQQLQITGGLHLSSFQFNNQRTLEPRLGLRYQVNTKQAFNAGLGWHSRLEPISVYLVKKQVKTEFISPNRNLKSAKAFHLVGGYDYLLNDNLRLKIEAYYQKLMNVPVDTNRKSYYTMLNVTSGLSSTPLSNDGEGKNYGMELTLEKYFANRFYYLLTASAFRSKYKAKDNIWRNTIFANDYVINVLAGKDFLIGKRHFWGINTRFMQRGGNRYVPIDLAKSIKANQTVLDNTQAYETQMPAYARFDVGTSYRVNQKHISWIFALDIQNALNRTNIYRYRFNNITQTIESSYNLPLVPVLSLRAEF